MDGVNPDMIVGVNTEVGLMLSLVCAPKLNETELDSLYDRSSLERS